MVPLLDQVAGGGAQAPVSTQVHRADTRGGAGEGRARGGNAPENTARRGTQG